MWTSNIDINDRLINGQMGTILKIAVDNTNKPTIIFGKFDDTHAGISAIEKCTDTFARQNQAVPFKESLYNKVEHEIVSVYYSDHEAIMINVNH